MKARDVMSERVATAREDWPADKAIALLLSGGCDTVPVVDTDGHVVGVVSQADLVRGRLRPDGQRADLSPSPPVEKVMTRSAITREPDEDLAELAATMLDLRIHSVPIVENGRLVGIVSRADVLRAVAGSAPTRTERAAPRPDTPVTRILVGYASAHGSTTEVAEQIARRLAERGLWVDCIPMAEMPGVAAYDAFVFGSAIHDRAWLPEAVSFVRGHARVLAGKPVWLFSVGIPTAVMPSLRGWAMREGPRAVEGLRTKVGARGEHLFSGVITPDRLSLPGRFVFRLLGGRYGDHRNRGEIDRWADEVARELGE